MARSAINQLFTSSSNLRFPNELVVIVPGLLLAARHRLAHGRYRYLYLPGQRRHFHAQFMHSPITQQTGRFNNMRILVRCPHLFVVHIHQLGNTLAHLLASNKIYVKVAMKATNSVSPLHTVKTSDSHLSYLMGGLRVVPCESLVILAS